MSHSRPDPSSPSAVAAAGFTTSRRGFEQAEVRDFLRMVAAELARLQEREAFLERELHTAQRANAGGNITLDDELVTRMLGEEATRVLQTAREGASQIKARAEESAARLLREATDEAQRLREEAEVEAARKRNDAAADAEAELQMAKQQGRDMVKEAQDYRERVLSELGRRRELARQQIEQLGHGRDRLLQAFERARLVSIDVMAELTPLGQPEEYVNLAPTTGPVPLMVPASAAVPTRMQATAPVDEADEIEEPDAADADATIALTRTDEAAADVADDVLVEVDVVEVDVFDVVDADQADDVDETFEMIAVVDVVDVDGDVQRFDLTSTVERLHDVGDAMANATPTVAPNTDEPSPAASDAAAGAVSDDVTDVVTDDVTDAGADAGADDRSPSMRLDIQPAGDAPHDDDPHREPAPVVSLFGEDRNRADKTKPSVDELFAKLRASRTDQVARRAAADQAVAAVTSELAAVVTESESEAEGEAGAETQAETQAESDESLRAVAAATDESSAASSEDSVFLATPDAPPVAVAIDDSPFARRDEALTPIIVGAARRLKRVLADEQNEVLHTLRRNDPVRSVDALVPALADHESRYAGAVDGDLLDAALAGAASMGAERSDVRRDFVRKDVTRAAVDVLAAELVRPLRDRLARAVVDADGDNGELANLVRTVYREWKNQRIDEQLDDIVQMAFGRGALAAATSGSEIRWIVDPNGPACPDAEDNALAGVIRAGEPFPTEHQCAPAHRGCRCMIAPVIP